ncbi:MAG TPA: CoA transferase [Acidimicrobiales bacterium]|nr:CoA transferase [Acidimicrobiales bacterium]
MPTPLLHGLRVLDLGIWRPVPYATQLLAEMGADVIKIEPPGGDPMRVFPPLFDVLNAGKRSTVADLKDPEGRARVLELAADAEVVMEGFRPGVADRLGVGYAAVRACNPSVVYCSISGYGATGPLAPVPGHDINYQAYAGVLAPSGGPPRAATIPVGDLGAGMAAAMAVLAACLRARASGEGEYVDVGIADVLATWTGAVGTLTPAGSPVPMNGMPGYGIYRTADDRYVTMGVLAEQHFWSRMCRALALEGLEDLPLGDRIRRKVELDEQVASAVARRTLKEVQADLVAHDVPVAPVLDRAAMLALDHFRERGTVLGELGPGAPATPALGHPARYEVHPARTPGPVPVLDETRTVSWGDGS